MPKAVTISGAVEGLIDEAVLRRLIRWAGAVPGPIYGKHGKSFLRKQMDAYNLAACSAPWLVLVDLDHDADCAPTLLDVWLPEPAPHMCFRVVVREIEAWLLADHERLAHCLNVRYSMIPRDPESLHDPKHTLVEIAKKSRRKDIRADMVPSLRSYREVGPAYNSRMIQFVLDELSGWRPEAAAQSSESLMRCLHHLERMAIR
ncbi:MAG: hypothetical protein C4520_00625 [Candidatus Abyssobacteria bacterium SURF_5]|uniref:DUF4276 family protein n=1 Tax=Abyssobacteria bacterium (strain SURF_5) TaxID=2093360 RepID=A0A3A4P0Y7_ABYX5|nr:MAG: hypothetical protein C4520_00625 [Candidatus Abyssubacteria bacterium SURF_5]